MEKRFVGVVLVLMTLTSVTVVPNMIFWMIHFHCPSNKQKQKQNKNIKLTYKYIGVRGIVIVVILFLIIPIETVPMRCHRNNEVSTSLKNHNNSREAPSVACLGFAWRAGGCVSRSGFVYI